MKYVILASTLLLSSAQAFSHLPVGHQKAYQAEGITPVLISPLHENLAAIDGGNVVVDVSKKKITLTLARPYHCPPGRFCAAMMPAPLVIELPLVKVSRTECNSTVYMAHQDMRIADGALEEISVVDHSRDTCRYFVAVPVTEISYTSQILRQKDPVVSTFKAELLELLPELMN